MNHSGDSNILRSKVVGTAAGLDSAPLADSLAGRSGRRFILFALPLGMLLIAIGSWLVWSVDRSTRQLTQASLNSLLIANTNALEQWLAEVGRQSESGLKPDPITESAVGLLKRRATGGQPDQDDSASGRAFRPHLDPGWDDALGWALVDLDRHVVASNHDPLIGQSLDVPTDAVERIIRRETTVSRPFSVEAMIPTRSHSPASTNGPIMCAMAPVADEGRAIGFLAILLDPLDQFSQILSTTRTGESGQTYAFDRYGVLISQSRFESQLREIGLLDSDPTISSVLNVQIRDPGVDLTRGGSAKQERSQQPLTQMADQATRGATAQNVWGYNDYRGVPVVGAWCWLPDYGIGVATEIDVAEAYAPIALLRHSLYVLFGALLVGGVGWWLLGSALRRWHGRPLDSNGSRRLGSYELGDLIGRGGMGDVYHGNHPLLNREVAIKVLQSDRELNRLTIARFEREVRMTAQLRHPNTIDIYDFGRANAKTFYYVMEFVDGITLQELVDRCGRQSPARVIHLLLQVCGSLSEAHALGIIHRDIKPSNLLLTARSGMYDMVKVLDFGLVKRIDPDADHSEPEVELTQSDGITGTPTYMSPESVRDAASADAKSDLYSVGAVGYILLTGTKVFDGESSVDVCLKQLNDQPQRPSDRIGQPLPEDLQNVLMSCLRKSPEERPLSADDLADSLRQCRDAGDWTASDAVQWWEAGIH